MLDEIYNKDSTTMDYVKTYANMIATAAERNNEREVKFMTKALYHRVRRDLDFDAALPFPADILIEELELSVVTYNFAKRAGINTLADAAKYKGVKGLIELRNKFQEIKPESTFTYCNNAAMNLQDEVKRALQNTV